MCRRNGRTGGSISQRPSYDAWTQSPGTCARPAGMLESCMLLLGALHSLHERVENMKHICTSINVRKNLAVGTSAQEQSVWQHNLCVMHVVGESYRSLCVCAREIYFECTRCCDFAGLQTLKFNAYHPCQTHRHRVALDWKWRSRATRRSLSSAASNVSVPLLVVVMTRFNQGPSATEASHSSLEC